MLPIKIELTEELAVMLRQLRLNNPINGEILTAEKLSKAIGNNRAWMSQIESRRLKNIKREDIIKVYKLLHNETDDAKAEKLVEIDLCIYEDSFSNSIETLDKTLNEFKKILTEKYTTFSNDSAKISLLICLKTIISNFKQDYEHASKIYSVSIGYDNLSKYINDETKDQYDSALNDICINYTLAVNELHKKTNKFIFLTCSSAIYQTILSQIASLNSTSTIGEISGIVLEIMNYNQNLFDYIKTPNLSIESQMVEYNIDNLFSNLLHMIASIFNKFKPEYNFFINPPDSDANIDELSKLELEINNMLLDLIQYVSSP